MDKDMETVEDEWGHHGCPGRARKFASPHESHLGPLNVGLPLRLPEPS